MSQIPVMSLMTRKIIEREKADFAKEIASRGVKLTGGGRKRIGNLVDLNDQLIAADGEKTVAELSPLRYSVPVPLCTT